MANRGYGFSLDVNTTIDENGNGIAFAKGTFVVLDDNSRTMPSPVSGTDYIVIDTLLVRGDTSATLRSRLIGALQVYMEDPLLVVEWLDEA